MADLLVIVPTRGRPGNVRRVLDAWDATDAWDDARILLARDGDDPQRREYEELVKDRSSSSGLLDLTFTEWLPMVHKLDAAARSVTAVATRPFAVGFAGDDHLPRTAGWARRYLDELRELGTGIVYGDDLLQHERIPTQWAMTSDIVQALGRMVPPMVEHMYCDDAVLALGSGVGCIRYLPDVVVEHVHPIARKTPWDEQYIRVNRREQYARDRAAYLAWMRDGLAADIAKINALVGVRPS